MALASSLLILTLPRVNITNSKNRASALCEPRNPPRWHIAPYNPPRPSLSNLLPQSPNQQSAPPESAFHIGVPHHREEFCTQVAGGRSQMKNKSEEATKRGRRSLGQPSLERARGG